MPTALYIKIRSIPLTFPKTQTIAFVLDLTAPLSRAQQVKQVVGLHRTNQNPKNQLEKQNRRVRPCPPLSILQFAQYPLFPNNLNESLCSRLTSPFIKSTTSEASGGSRQINPKPKTNLKNKIVGCGHAHRFLY